MVPAPALPKLGSPLDTIAKRSPFGSHEKSVTVSMRRVKENSSKQARNHTFQLDNFYWEVLFAHAEYLEVAKHRLFSLGVAVNPDTEEVTPILPIQPTLKEDANQLRWTDCKARLYNPTSDTLNKFFWQRTDREGKLISVTRAG